MRHLASPFAFVAVMVLACDVKPPAGPPAVPPTEKVETPEPAPKQEVAPVQPEVTAKVEAPTEEDRTRDEENSIDVFRAAAPATVFVTQKRVVQDRFSMRALEVPAGSGTGFLWDTEGHVVTNAHVVEGARSLEVTLYDKSTFPAKVVGVDPNNDIAVLAIEAPSSKLVRIRIPGEDLELAVGQKALAIGNPFGLDHTLTVGVISALGREVKGFGNVTIRGMVQTDASINPGNSGGPLLNSSGELIGMNTMIFSQSGASAGIGFAVPVKTIGRLVPQLIKHGKPQQAGFGVQVVPDEVAQQNGITGVAILKVMPGTSAEKSGLVGLRETRDGVLLGDVIVGIDDAVIENYDDLYHVLNERKAGDVVTVKIRRDGAVRELRIELMNL